MDFMKVHKISGYLYWNPDTVWVMPTEGDSYRLKTLQAATRLALESMVQQMELSGWARMGEMALAKPTLDSKPPYWVQSMSHPSWAPFEPEPRAGLQGNGGVGINPCQTHAEMSPAIQTAPTKKPDLAGN
jgi:hypothetical protein